MHIFHSEKFMTDELEKGNEITVTFLSLDEEIKIGDLILFEKTKNSPSEARNSIIVRVRNILDCSVGHDQKVKCCPIASCRTLQSSESEFINIMRSV